MSVRRTQAKRHLYFELRWKTGVWGNRCKCTFFDLNPFLEHALMKVVFRLRVYVAMQATPTSCAILSTTCRDARLLPFSKGKSMSYKFCFVKLPATVYNMYAGSFSGNETFMKRRRIDDLQPKNLSQCTNLAVWGWSLPMKNLSIQEVADACIYHKQRERRH